MRCVPLIPSYVLNTYSMCKKCLENFLEQRQTTFASHTIFIFLVCPTAVEYSDKAAFFTYFFDLVAL